MTNQMVVAWIKTGEIRSPLEGEWFISDRNTLDQAFFDFRVQKFEILSARQIPFKELAHKGDPCEFCGKPMEEVLPGPCRGLCFCCVEVESPAMEGREEKS